MKIIIVDDDPIVRQSLCAIAELGSRKTDGEPITVVATGADGKEAVDLYLKHRPDIILLDIRMDHIDGLSACKTILEADAEAKILFLTTFLDDEYIIQALRLGAKGYLMKTSIESLLPALYAIHRGQRVYGDEIIEKIPPLLSAPTPVLPTGQNQADLAAAHIDQGGRPPVFEKLTEREWELVKLVAAGANNKEIATALHLSEGTVRNYLSTILEKTNLRDRTLLAIAYYKAI